MPITLESREIEILLFCAVSFFNCISPTGAKIQVNEIRKKERKLNY